jgi:Arc/MetJ family transcription regulator
MSTHFCTSRLNRSITEYAWEPLPLRNKASDEASNKATLEAFNPGRKMMRITLTLDDELLAKAQALTGLTESIRLVTEALRALIERESAKRLALLGGSEPQLEDILRRRLEPSA